MLKIQPTAARPRLTCAWSQVHVPVPRTHKLRAGGRQIATIRRARRRRSYDRRRHRDERSPLPGALQIVFCDLSTPSGGETAGTRNYAGLRDR